MSSGSVYSQESYRSPFVPVVNSDTRRQAVVFSASLQWTDLSDEEVDMPVEVEAPLRSASIVEVFPAVSKEDSPASLGSDVYSPNSKERSADDSVNLEVDTSAKSNITQATSATKLKKKRSTEDASTPKRTSKHAKAFGKIMRRISLQPSKKELSEKRQADAPSFNIVHLAPEYKLPALLTPGPIRVSFIAQVSPLPAMPALPVAVLASIPDVASSTENPPRLRLMIPAAPNRPSGSTTPPPPATPAHPAKKGHRRYKSSPAVANFAFKGWDIENMPPLPMMPPPPAGAPMRERPRSHSFANAKPIVRAITPPFPLNPSRRMQP